MKRFLLPSLALLLIGCGPSDQEKQETAIITCNIMGETLNMDAADRIREINAAREKIGESAFLGKDSDIKEAFQYDLCKELVLNDPNYNSKLDDLIEQERLALEERLEAERIAREEREEAERIAREEREEAERITEEKNILAYTNSIKSVFDKITPKTILTDIKIIEGSENSLRFAYSCRNRIFMGLGLKSRVKFVDELGEIQTISLCLDFDDAHVRILFDRNNPKLFDAINSYNPITKIESITLEWTGGFYLDKYENYLFTAEESKELIEKLDPNNFGNVKPDISQLPHTWVIYPK